MATPPSTMQWSCGSSFHRHSLFKFVADAPLPVTVVFGGVLSGGVFGGVLSGGEGPTDDADLREVNDDFRIASFDPVTAPVESFTGTSSLSRTRQITFIIRLSETFQNERRIIQIGKTVGITVITVHLTAFLIDECTSRPIREMCLRSRAIYDCWRRNEINIM